MHTNGNVTMKRDGAALSIVADLRDLKPSATGKSTILADESQNIGDVTVQLKVFRVNPKPAR